jgi:hypothetical protein
MLLDFIASYVVTKGSVQERKFEFSQYLKMLEQENNILKGNKRRANYK